MPNSVTGSRAVPNSVTDSRYSGPSDRISAEPGPSDRICAEPDIQPVDADRWGDLLALFGPNGAYSNCWCTWWILTGKEYSEARPEQRRAVLENLTISGEEPGLLAYEDGVPVGWCAVGPRERYTRMMSPRSVVYRPVDDADGNWVINCFYIPRSNRRQGLASQLLAAAVDYSFSHGAESIDGYPLEDTSHGANSLYVGTVSMFEREGFSEISRVKSRPLMRRYRKRSTS